MDSEKRAKQANIIAFLMGIPGWVTLALMLWYRRYPDPSTEPDMVGRAGALMTGWLPVIVISASLTLAVIGQVIAAFRAWKNKTLKVKVCELEAKIEAQTKDISTLRDRLAASEKETKDANARTKNEENQRENFTRLEAEARRRLAELAWVSQMMEGQANNISEHVAITAVKAGKLRLHSPRLITVALRIRNESLFDITIQAENVKGHLFFKTKPFKEPARIADTDNPPIENLKPKQLGTLVIEQPLLQSEAETIQESNGDERFWLGNLSIPISVENVPQQVEIQDLRIRAETEHIYLQDFGFGTTALILDEHAMTPKELIQSINELRPTLRAKVYQEALSAYVAALVQESNAEADKDPEINDDF